MRVAPLHAILHLLCFSDLSYPSLWSIINYSHQDSNSRSFYGISRGALIVCHRFPSFSASSCLEVGCCPTTICRCLPLEKQWTVPALCSRAEASRAEAGQQQGPCLWHKGEAYSLHTESLGTCRLPFSTFSQISMSPQLFHESPPKAEAAVTHAGTAVACLECSWLNWHLSAS